MRATSLNTSCVQTKTSIQQLPTMYEGCTSKRSTDTVEPVLKHCHIGHKNVVSQDRWSLVTGSLTLNTHVHVCRTFCQEHLVFQDRRSLMPVVSQDRFHCTVYTMKIVPSC